MVVSNWCGFDVSFIDYELSLLGTHHGCRVDRLGPVAARDLAARIQGPDHQLWRRVTGTWHQVGERFREDRAQEIGDGDLGHGGLGGPRLTLCSQLSQGIVGWVAKHREPVIVNNPANDARHDDRITASSHNKGTAISAWAG